jgi:hypothetical protein
MSTLRKCNLFPRDILDIKQIVYKAAAIGWSRQFAIQSGFADFGVENA